GEIHGDETIGSLYWKATDYKNLDSNFKGFAYLPVEWSTKGATRVLETHSHLSSIDEVYSNPNKARSVDSKLRFEDGNLLPLNETFAKAQDRIGFNIARYRMNSDFKMLALSHYGLEAGKYFNADTGRLDIDGLTAGKNATEADAFMRKIDDLIKPHKRGEVSRNWERANWVYQQSKNLAMRILINPAQGGAWGNVGQGVITAQPFIKLQYLMKNLPSGLGTYAKYLTKNTADISLAIKDIETQTFNDPALKATLEDYFTKRFSGSQNDLFEMQQITDIDWLKSTPDDFQNFINHSVRLATDGYTGSDLGARVVMVKSAYDMTKDILNRNNWKAKNVEQAFSKADKVISDLGLMGAGPIKVDRLRQIFNHGVETGNMQPFYNQVASDITTLSGFSYDMAHTPELLVKARRSRITAPLTVLSSWSLFKLEQMRAVFGQAGTKGVADSLKPLIRTLTQGAAAIAYSTWLLQQDDGKRRTTFEKLTDLKRDSEFEKGVYKYLYQRQFGFDVLSPFSDRIGNPLGAVFSISKSVYKGAKYRTNEKYRRYRDKKGYGDPLKSYYTFELFDYPYTLAGIAFKEAMDLIPSEEGKKMFERKVAPIVTKVAKEELSDIEDIKKYMEDIKKDYEKDYKDIKKEAEKLKKELTN
ncbi:MAG: hypothetical protein DRP09_18875, partial [Candidatus Thorarchaeota archaeon]